MSKFLKIFAPAATGAAGMLALAYTAADQFIVDIPAPIREAIAINAAVAEEARAEAEARAAELAMAGLAPSADGGYGLGRGALSEEVAAWDTDVRPDGHGLPVGSGDVFTGEEVFVERCAMCHGDFGEAVGRWPVLAGGHGTLEHEDPVKTIGSYWPYLSTVYDYVKRAMPFGDATSLSDDEVYAITAYLLYVNDLVDDDFELSNENFQDVRLPNEANFIDDDRMTTEIPAFVRPEICMENCKDAVEITMHASVLDVTPEETAAKAAAAAEAATAAEAAPAAAVEEAATAEVTDAAADAAPSAELIAAGEGVFRQCRSCHQVGEGARNATGPTLNGVVGAHIGSVDGFRYSNTFKDANEAGDVWSADRLAEFLADPRGSMAGTKMAFAGLRTQEDIDAIIAYLSTFSR